MYIYIYIYKFVYILMYVCMYMHTCTDTQILAYMHVHSDIVCKKNYIHKRVFAPAHFHTNGFYIYFFEVALPRLEKAPKTVPKRSFERYGSFTIEIRGKHMSVKIAQHITTHTQPHCNSYVCTCCNALQHTGTQQYTTQKIPSNLANYFMPLHGG